MFGNVKLEVGRHMADQTQKGRRRLRVLGACAVAAGAVFLAMGLGTGPAAAQTVANHNPGVTATQSVATEGLNNNGPGGDDQCTKDVCKRINWCDAGKSRVVKDDAPTVVLTKGGKSQDCVKRPTVKKVVCCDQGAGNVKVWITNPNCYKLRVEVTVDNGAPVIKWIEANGEAEFDFSHVGNGNHTVRASVWTKGKVWCNFAKLCITVKCSSPSPTPSQTQSHSPSPSPSVSHTTSPSPSQSSSHTASPSPSKSSAGALPPINHTGNNLPVTGPPTGGFVIGGLVLLAIGVGAVLFGRRRNHRVVAD